jgi:ribose-phosphate pyrophosphokinase
MTAILRGSAKILAGDAHPALAEKLAHELQLPLLTAEISDFADGETRVRVAEDVRDAHVFVVQPTCPPVNDHLMVLALLTDAVHAAGAARVVGVVPYFGYARQEQRGRVGDPRSAQVVGRLLACAGLDHLVTLDLHAPALESALPMPATLLQAEEVFLPRVQAWGVRDLVVVAPDAGGLKRAQRYALALGASLAVVAKERPRPDAATSVQLLGTVTDRVCLVVDDMASTGRTLAGAADALRRAGAKEVHAVFTHAVMAPGALDRLRAARFGRVLTTDSIPTPPETWLEVVPVAPLLARAVRSLRGEAGLLDQ